MQGLLLVDKPGGWTSFDAVNFVRRQVALAEGKKPKNVKVGHSGTLDPLATGLLVLLVGKEYTRRAQIFSKLPKTYEVTMRLGYTSTTGDEEGEKQAVSVMEPGRPELEAAMRQFLGDSMQIPPAYSAIKVNGQRAYALARHGKEVRLEPRPIHISELTITEYKYPYVSFRAAVGSGTYIRSLVEDIGGMLGTGAYMSGLRRTRVGDFSIDYAHLPDGEVLRFLRDSL